MTLSTDDPRHGTNAGHVAGCKEMCCRRAKLRYDKQRKHELETTGKRRTVPIVGFRRRMRALQALGWSFPQVAPMIGLSTSTLSSKMNLGDTVYRRNHDAMVKVYNELAMITPTGPKVERDRRNAAKKGWLPPLAWDDETIDDPDAQPYRSGRTKDRTIVDEVLVQRAMNGQKVDATKAERQVIIRRWQADGRSLNQLDEKQGWNVRRDLREAS